MERIGPCLSFDDQAEAAARFYVSVFRNSRILGITHYLAGMPKPEGSVMTVNFVLDGQEFMALNGGPSAACTLAVSFVVPCADQAEVDRLWQQLSEGGQERPCGWLTDRYGISWQIVPRPMLEMLSRPDKAAAQRAVNAMLKMRKLDLAALERAYRGEA